MRYAIIDLGTNTFNLLIVEGVSPDKYNIIFNDKLPVKLGLGGINNRLLTPEAVNRGVGAMVSHKEKILEHKAGQVFAFATSAIRDASNGGEFKKKVWQETGIDIRIISGDKEAQYIYQGVKKAFPFTDQVSLILDIGGGSNEFIFANENGPLWARSYDVGIARLLDRFVPSEPITPKQLAQVNAFLNQELNTFLEVIPKYGATSLVGASGTFDTFRSMMLLDQKSSVDIINPTCVRLEKEAFENLTQKLTASTTEERKMMPGMEPMRIEMIVLASIFVTFTLEKTGIQNLYQTDYSLKEGVLSSIFENK